MTRNMFFSNLAKPWVWIFIIFLPAFLCPKNQQTHRETMRIHGIYWKIIWLLVKTLAPSEPQNSW